MRKVQQEKILELLKTLREAHGRLKEQTGADDFAVTLLADCQEFAFQIGLYIENIEGEGTRTVTLLEEYCETAFKASLEKDVKLYIPLLKEALTQIEACVRGELKPNKIEVAFFPYMLSMFDAFESIYSAAKADPNCEVYVVPIPWFGRLPNGRIGEMHYDGNQYPRHIDITDWQAYDVENRHPDIIFIHNPYDEGNYLTTVHPAYYSKCLCQHTDCLIYIPYFVSTGNIQEAFCATPACYYAHKVILSSKEERDVYIRVYKQNYDNVFGRPEDKFIVLGSPKYDAVAHTKKKDYSLPRAWEKKILNLDGTNKKVILYNTAITAALQNGEKYLDKLSSVLEVFEKRGDLALWWRPHPLSETMYQSMRPSLWNKYENILTLYKNAGWGIYDDTPDLHRAITFADGMLSDSSSLVALFQTTGKPTLIQNVDVLEAEVDEIETKLFSICEAKNCFWFTDDRFNGLFEVLKSNKSIKYVGKFDAEKDKNTLYRLSAYDERSDKLYFAPYNAKSIAIYNIADKKFSYIPLQENSCPMGYFMPVLYGDFVFFTPYKAKSIMKLDIFTHQVSYFDDWLGAFEKESAEVSDAYFLFPAVNQGNIILASCKSNIVVVFDMDKGTSVIYNVGAADFRYSGCCFDGINYWLTPRFDSPIVIWNPEVGIVKEFDVKRFVSCPENRILFQPAVYMDGIVWLFPREADCILKINADSFAFEIIMMASFMQRKDIAGKPGYYSTMKSLFAQRFDDKIYIFDNYENQLVVFDGVGHSVEKWDMKYSVDVRQSIFSANQSYFQINRNIFGENKKQAFLSEFINYVVRGYDEARNEHCDVKYPISIEGTVGRDIYNYVKKLVASIYF